MPNSETMKAADKAYEKHSKDNTGLALKSKMSKAPSSEELQTMKDAGLPVPKAPEIEKVEEEVELTPKEKAQGATDILQAASANAIGPAEQVQPAQTYDMASVESEAPPVDLFQLYNL